jgi:hypothetical protein
MTDSQKSHLDAESQLTGEALSSLAARMVTTADAVKGAKIRKEIVRGFYGGKPNGAAHSTIK